jgi:cyclophilin family peptidyl-prolyl cis-trans isomerase/HEAT repeat protein
VIARLITEAKRLQTSQSNTEWQVPMAALAALARLSVKDAAEINATLAHHDVWQVRDAVAHVANQLGDINRVIAFVHDPHPNVRTTALRLLADDQVAGLARLAIEALTSDDYQLVRTAVAVLARTNASTDAIPPLMDALSRITRDNKDTSRDVRVDIINRLSQMPAFDTTLFFVPFEKGFDMAVRDAAISAIATILKRSDFPMGTPPEAVLPTGTPPEAILAPPQIRLQPSATDLQPLPTTATIEMADRSGTIQLQFLSDQTEAPVTIWRFAEAAKRGYYNNRPFYRVVTDVMVQGGSPGDNEDMSDVFFMRDEVGLERHTRGAVGISVEDAPGHDTGALQFFIDLVDAPQIDHRRTVFARVASGMDVVDRLLEGATIKTVTVK